MEDQRFHVVAGRRQRAPDEAAHVEFVARCKRGVVAEAVAALARGLQQQRLFVPGADRGLDAGGMTMSQPKARFSAALPPMWSECEWVLIESRQAPAAQRLADQRHGLLRRGPT